jgi:hypothetical protein
VNRTGIVLRRALVLLLSFPPAVVLAIALLLAGAARGCA